MPTLKNKASALVSNRNREVPSVQPEQPPSSTQQDPDRSHKKRRHKDSIEGNEKRKKKRKRQESSSVSHSGTPEWSNPTANANANTNGDTIEARSTTSSGKGKKKKQSKEVTDVETDGSQDEQRVAELLEIPVPSSTKKKKKRPLPTFAIDPQLLHGPSNPTGGSVETSPSPEPRLTRPLDSPGADFVDYSTMNNAPFMFTSDSIDPEAFGLKPGASSEDILRVIKNMDLSALTRPADRSDAGPSESGSPQRKLDFQNIRIPTNTNVTDQTKLLSTKWLSTKDLKKLEEEQGLQYKRGPFSKTETSAIDAALKLFSIEHGISVEDTIDLIFVGRGEMKAEYKNFWFHLASVVPMRPLISVFNYCKRAYHPLQKQGKWTPEEDKLLKEAFAEFGQKWGKVGERVGRMGQDCRDRWRNYIKLGDNRTTGPWTQEETDELAAIMKEYGAETAQRPEGDSFWLEISNRMGGKRNRQQIRIKWQDSLSKQVKVDGPAPRWRPLDSYILVHKVATMDVADDSEIDWNLLPDPDWNLWSAHSLQRRWLTMKRGVADHENMPFAELLDILKAKKGSLMPSEIEGEIQRAQQTRLKERREPVSKETIENSDAELESDS